MNKKWRVLLNQLEIFQLHSEKSFWEKEDIKKFEHDENIILPAEYKIFCQVFGTGILGEDISIFRPDYYYYKLIRKDFDQYVLLFGRIEDECLLFWDLRTYSDLDRSYDIFIISEYGFPPYNIPHRVGRNFYFFIRDFCLGMKIPIPLPEESIYLNPYIFIHTFSPFNVDVLNMKRLKAESQNSELKQSTQNIENNEQVENDDLVQDSLTENKKLYSNYYLKNYLNLPHGFSDKYSTSDTLYQENVEKTQAVKENKFYAFFRYLKTFKNHLGPINCVRFSPNGETVVSASADKTIKLWNLTNYQEAFTLIGHTQTVLALAISPDGNILASGSADNTIKLWNLRTGEEIQTLLGHNGSVLCLAISPDGQTLVSASADCTVKIWNLNMFQLIHTLTGHTKSVLCIAINPDGKTFASGSADRTVKFWYLSTGQEIYTLQKKSGFVFSLDFHPSKQILISGSGDETVKIWDLRSFEIIRTISVHGVVSSLMISPDGENIACGYQLAFQRVACIWELATGKLITYFKNDDNRDYPLINHCDCVYSVAFSPNGKQLATGSRDTTVKLWGIPPSLEYIE